MENKPKFNFIDGLIVLLVVLIAAGGVFYSVRRSKSSDSAVSEITVEYKMELLEREQPIVDQFLAAQDRHDTVWVGEKERAEAEIVSVEVKPARKLTVDEVNGTASWAENPELSDITVTLRSTGTESDTDIKAGNTAIHVGEETSVKGKGYAGYGFITDMKIAD